MQEIVFTATFAITSGFFLGMFFEKNRRVLQSSKGFNVFIDTLHIDRHHQEFTTEKFNEISENIDLPSAIIFFERHFLDYESFLTFLFTVDQLRQIALASYIGKNKTSKFPNYLRQRSILILAEKVTNLKDAVSEYKILSHCLCIDTENMIDSMVRKFMKTIDDCQYVIDNISSEYCIHKGAQEKKRNLENKLVVTS
jgi:hypothetical protein